MPMPTSVHQRTRRVQPRQHRRSAQLHGPAMQPSARPARPHTKPARPSFPCARPVEYRAARTAHRGVPSGQFPQRARAHPAPTCGSRPQLPPAHVDTDESVDSGFLAEVDGDEPVPSRYRRWVNGGLRSAPATVAQRERSAPAAVSSSSRMWSYGIAVTTPSSDPNAPTLDDESDRPATSRRLATQTAATPTTKAIHHAP